MNGRRRRARGRRAAPVRAPGVLAAAAAGVGAVALFAVWHVLAERTVYVWDAAASWRAAGQLTDAVIERLAHDLVELVAHQLVCATTSCSRSARCSARSAATS